MGDFECIVVDDASRLPIAPVVADYDERFIYIRNDSNLGPAGAKRVGFERMRGQFVAILDSDDEFFPWTLERATTYLDQWPDVGGVSGLWVYPDGLRTRIAGGAAVFTREDYVLGNVSPADCPAVIRRASIAEWLEQKNEYFATEFAFWLSHRLRRSQLFIDEPWGRIPGDASDRVSTQRDARLYRDLVTLVEQYREEIGIDECAPVDRFLRQAWMSLLRGGRWKEARIVGAWMSERRIGRLETMLAEFPARARARARRPAHKPMLQPVAAHSNHLSGVADDG